MKVKDLQSLVCHAVINNELPEVALSWDIVEEVHTTIARGSGESTSWDQYVLIRQNGKQVWRDTKAMFEYKKPLQTMFDNRLVEVCKIRNGTLYVVKPLDKNPKA